LHVFICEILANMTQVSDVAPGPLVSIGIGMQFHIRFIFIFVSYSETSLIEMSETSLIEMFLNMKRI
jgi:hypothetical protein